MWWKKGTIVVLIIFFVSVTWGIITVYDRLPQSVVGNSGFKIYCSKKPLEVKVETAGYDVYLLDGKIFSNIKEDASAAFNKLIGSVKGNSKKINKETNDSSKEINDNNDNNDNNNDINQSDNNSTNDLQNNDNGNNGFNSHGNDSNTTTKGQN